MTRKDAIKNLGIVKIWDLLENGIKKNGIANLSDVVKEVDIKPSGELNKFILKLIATEMAPPPERIPTYQCDYVFIPNIKDYKSQPKQAIKKKIESNENLFSTQGSFISALDAVSANDLVNMVNELTAFGSKQIKWKELYEQIGMKSKPGGWWSDEVLRKMEVANNPPNIVKSRKKNYQLINGRYVLQKNNLDAGFQTNKQEDLHRAKQENRPIKMDFDDFFEEMDKLPSERIGTTNSVAYLMIEHDHNRKKIDLKGGEGQTSERIDKYNEKDDRRFGNAYFIVASTPSHKQEEKRICSMCKRLGFTPKFGCTDRFSTCSPQAIEEFYRLIPFLLPSEVLKTQIFYLDASEKKWFDSKKSSEETLQFIMNKSLECVI